MENMIRQTSMHSFTTDDRDIFTSGCRVSCGWRDSDTLRTISGVLHPPSFTQTSLKESRRRSRSIGDLISKWETLDDLDNDTVKPMKAMNEKEGQSRQSIQQTSLKKKFSSSFEIIEEDHEKISKSEIRFKKTWNKDGGYDKNKAVNKQVPNNTYINSIKASKNKDSKIKDFNNNNKDLNNRNNKTDFNNNNKDLNSNNNNKDLSNNNNKDLSSNNNTTVGSSAQLNNEITRISFSRMKPALEKESLLRYANLNSMNTLKPSLKVPRKVALRADSLSRKESYKVSRNLSRRMTKRQKQKLIMESEFDEFEDEDDKGGRVVEDDKGGRVVDRVKVNEDKKIGSGSGDSGDGDKNEDNDNNNDDNNNNNNNDSIKYNNNNNNKQTRGEKDVEKDDDGTGEVPSRAEAKAECAPRGSNECAPKGSIDYDEELILKLNLKNMQETLAFSTQDSSDIDAFEEEEEEEEDEDEGKVVLTKVQKIAEELLMTEKNYIDRLHLLDQLFQLNVTLANREQNFFPDHTIPEIFSNIKSIYQFHTFLYPQLQKAVVGQQLPKVGEVLSKYAPFLKLYIEYVRNFNEGINLLNYWLEKSPPFHLLILDLQKQPQCGHLSLQHHMLEPVQRVPRYELLLKDYLKNLPLGSPDWPLAEKSLKMVKDAAQHSNDAMRKIEKFKRLLDVNEKLGDSIDLVSPTRELVKEGRITRVARDGSSIDRYIFLFNDLLLVCQAGTLTQQYRIKSKMGLDDMEIMESHNLEIPNTFYVRCQEKSIELHCSTQEEKEEWQMAFWTVINEFQDKLKSRKKRMTIIYPVKTDVLGKRAPLWVKDNETSMCMRCSVAFTAFRRRHHCRACGLVVCKACSSFRAHLDFTGNHEDRVCTFCYQVLAGNQAGYLDDLGEVSVTQATSKVMEGFKAGKLRLQIKASSPSVMSGYMSLSRDRHNWTRRYFVAHSTFLLYSFKAHQDVVAMASMPLPGYHVKVADHNELLAKENMFKIYHDGEKKVYYFQVENLDIFLKWVDTLQMLSRLEIPPSEPTKEMSSQHNSKSH